MFRRRPESVIALAQPPDGISYKERWSLRAGKGCPDDEFDEFVATLGDPRCAQEALFGYNQKLMSTDPTTATTSTLQAL